jgi:quercetin dioxygenase-like cupin family protein
VVVYVAIMSAIAFGLAVASAAQGSKPEAERPILERHAQSDVASEEIVIGTAALPKGAVIGFHTHPGDEAAISCAAVRG